MMPISLLLSVAADLLDEAREGRDNGDFGAAALERQARQVLAAALDLQREITVDGREIWR